MSRRKLKKKSAAMPNLPEEIQIEIFTRLPAKSVSRLSCVSKSLSTVIASSEFTNMHLNNMKRNPSILYLSSMQKVCSIDYKSVSSLLPLSESSSVLYYTKFTNHRYPSIPVRYLYESLCSCDGWLCIRADVQEGSCICFWNPLTSEHKRIPGSDMHYANMSGGGVAYGLGYDCKIGDYKLARIVSSGIHSRIHVYALGSNEWKSIHQNIPHYEFAISRATEGVHLNGAIHWLARTIGKNLKRSKVVVSFDISNEILKEMALPEESIPDRLTRYKYDRQCNLDVGVLGGCLCLISHVLRVRVDVWVMQQYGVGKSWTKSFTITQKAITHSHDLKLIWSFENHEILWEIDGGFVLYDPKNESYGKLMTRKYEVKKHKFIAGNYVAIK